MRKKLMILIQRNTIWKRVRTVTVMVVTTIIKTGRIVQSLETCCGTT